MIVKSFELGKINFEKGKVFLFYGKNEGLKNEIIDNKRDQKKIVNYEEKTILEDKENFLNNFLSNSFFEEEKIIVINRATDKILPIIEEIVDNQLNDEILIINSEILEKKSKLRKFFETDKKNICVPFYEDNYQTLLNAINNPRNSSEFNTNHVSSKELNLIMKLQRADYFPNWETIADTFEGRSIYQIRSILSFYNKTECFPHENKVTRLLPLQLRDTTMFLNPIENEMLMSTTTFLYRTT